MNGVHHAIASGFAFGLGASVGSFLNVCVWRLPRGESLVRPPSRCPRCGTAIAVRDNVPVVGWLVLRGRSRCCGGEISARYPVVEAAVGFLFAAVLLAEALSGTLDLTDREPLDVLGRLFYHWALVALVVTSGLIDYDRRRDPSLHPCTFARFKLAVLSATLVSLLAGDSVGALLSLALVAVFCSRASTPHFSADH